jgi:two-component system, sporulation sensor kinase D
VPSLAISNYFAQHKAAIVDDKIQTQANEFANFHAMNIENFLGETVGRLEMLATSLKLHSSNLLNIENILTETEGLDPRFSGFYWANPAGDILITTNPTTTLVNVADRPYFQEALKKKQTSVSEAHFGRITGRLIITIATPIVENDQIKGVLMASLRLDELEAAIIDLSKNETIIVTDTDNRTLIKTGNIGLYESTLKDSVKITQVPWEISAYVDSQTSHIFRKTLVEYLIIFLTITNILYLLVKYVLLRKKLQQEQEETELHKLELVGKLAASTAHEIRNPLTGIKGLVKLLSEEYKDEKAQSYFEVIQLEIDRINAIVSELLVLGKPTAYGLKTYNANDILKEIIPIIQSEANFMNVQLSIDYAAGDLPISCVKDHIKQVILNLAKNALQAMPDGGQLSISLARDRDYCVIHVVDNGVGMSKEQLRQAFQPFYTLKKDGSGLGLTVCKRMLETYDGEISIDSTPHIGTRVEISLPLHTE